MTSDGVLVVDGQGRTDQVERMVTEIGTLTTQPIRYVVVGSHHGDHTGGYTAFPDTATFIAHPTSQAALARATTRPARGGGPAQVVVPTETVEDRRVLNMGETEIQILHLGRAHTGGDLVVYLPAEKVLFMSESYLHRMFPSVAGGYPSEWIEAIRRAEQMDVDFYVPGHGFVDDPGTLEAELGMFRQALETVVAEGTRLRAAGVSVEDAPAQENLGGFADWSISGADGASRDRARLCRAQRRAGLTHSQPGSTALCVTDARSTTTGTSAVVKRAPTALRRWRRAW